MPSKLLRFIASPAVLVILFATKGEAQTRLGAPERGWIFYANQ